MQAIKIRDIVETYEGLSERQREKIIRIAERQIEEQEITGFDSQYRYVARLVEEFQQPYAERIALRLDHPPEIYGGYDRNLHQVIADSHQVIADSRQEDSFGLPITTLQEAYRIAVSYMDERQRKIVTQLIQKSRRGEIMQLRLEEIIADFLGIKWRAHIVGRKMEEDVRFQQPERRITYFKLEDNPYFQWNRRRYNGRPIDFFRRHIDVYGRFVEEGRKALQRFDSGLFGALRDDTTEVDGQIVRQIELAIPKLKPRGNRGHNENIVKQIVLSYGCFDGNVTRASDALPYSRATIAKYWKTAELRIRSHRNGDFISKISDKEKQQIIEAHHLHGGSAYQAARDLPYHKSTIVRYWRQAGLPILKHKRRRVDHGSSSNKRYS